MLSLEQLNASLQASQGKNKPETSKEPKYIPKKTPRSEVVILDYCIKLNAEYKDLFEEPGTPVEQDVQHQIDLLNPDVLVKYHK